MRRAMTLAALAAMTMPAAALAARPACIAPEDARTVVSLALPDAVEALRHRCQAVLPPSAYLRSQGAALAQRYRGEAPVNSARARAAIEAVTGQDLSSLADDDTVLALAQQFVNHMVAARLATSDCDSVDTMVALAAPLRADAMSEAVLLALELAGPGAVGGYAICPAPQQVTRR